jgi:hypothetical protein|nr:MAG TPA: stabilization protein [Caudoviricetes sp.]
MANDTKIARRAFNAGEVSKAFKWRNDTEKHSMACERLENFYVDTLGGVHRRAGTKFLGSLGPDSENVRIIPFEYNRDCSYALVFKGNGGVDGYKCFSEDFSFTDEFSLCFVVPENVPTLDFLKKGNLKISYNANSSYLTLMLGDGADAGQANAGDKVVVIYKNNSATLYVNKSPAAAASGAFADDGGGIEIQTPDRGNMWGLKIFGFDMTATSAYYTLDDWQNQNAENLTRTPDVSPAADIRYQRTWAIDAFSDGNPQLKEEAVLLSGAVDWFSHSEYEDANYNIGVSELSNESGAVSASPQVKFNHDFDAALTDAIAAAELAQAQVDQIINQGNEPGAEVANALYAASENVKNIYANALGYESFEIMAGDGFSNSGSWKDIKTLTTTNQLPCAYEYFRIPFDVPVGAEIGITLPQGAKVYALASDGQTQLPTDGSHVSPVAYLVLRVEIGSYSGAENYGIPASASQKRLLIDKILNWEPLSFLTMDAYDAAGVKIGETLDTKMPFAALKTMQHKQAGGWIYLSHLSMPPKKVTFDGESFSIAEAVKFQPSENLQVDGAVLTLARPLVDGILYSGEIESITANNDFFTREMIGSQLKIEYSDNASKTYEWRTGKTNATKVESVPVSGKFTVPFVPCGKITLKPQGGVWDGVLLLEESTDNGKTWNEIARTTSMQGSDNETVEREIFDVNSVVRARMESMNTVVVANSEVLNSAKEGCLFSIYSGSRGVVWVKVLAVDSPTSATVEFINPCRSTFTSSAVYRSAWSEDFGYPRAVEIHEERLVFGGNLNQPSTIWLSQTNNWDNFRSVSNLDTDPLAYTLASDDGEPVSWLVSRSDLMVGMGSSEWSFGSRDAGQALTASIVHASNQSEDGVEYVMPTKAGGMVIYVRRGNRELGAISYDFASDSYNSVSLTTMNPEIMGDGVSCVFNQLSPRNRIFAIRNDGQVAVFTYDKENNVAAWSRFLFGDGVAAGCALSTGKFKSVLFAVKRNGYLCLERLDSNEAQTGNYLDCVPVAGNTTIPAGLKTSVPYESLMRTTPLFLDANAKIFDLRFYMLDSYGGEYRVVGFDKNGDWNPDDWNPIVPRESELMGELLGTKTPRDYRFTGACDSGFLEEGAIELKTTETAPFTLCAIGAKIKAL